MRRSTMFLTNVFLVGLALGKDLGKTGVESLDGVSTPSITYPSEDQLPTPVPESKQFRRGELHLGRARIAVDQDDPAAVPRKYHSSAVASVIAATKTKSRLNETDTNICGNKKCERHEICIYHQKDAKHICVRMKASKASRRHMLSGKSRSSAKLDKSWNQTDFDVHRKVQKLKLRAQEFQEQHDQRFKISGGASRTKLRSKKFIDDKNLENNTLDKSNRECRQKELDGIGRSLLDQFKMNQDEDLDRQKMTNKRRKEKRNSTKKELHDDDECICQAPVSWQFQNLDVDTNGHLSQKELQNLTSKGTCVAQFISLCDHDIDANLSEKEWCCCFANILPPCLAALKNVPSILLRGQPMVLKGAYVPQCDDDGFYSRVQCHSVSGQCWCVDRAGRRTDSATTTGTPDCD